jgi:GNAT superfamily N-acetyltransferase
MSESTSPITVRRLADSNWAQFRQVRLDALHESPEAFSATRADEEALSEVAWLERVRRSPRFLAERDGAVLGTASVGRHRTQGDGSEEALLEDLTQVGLSESANIAEIYGLWVTPAARGTGVATALVDAACQQARDDGRSHIVYWVSTSNGRAVAFASGLGFRPSDSRRPMRGVGHVDEEEIAMILALGLDRGWSGAGSGRA